jgi:DNA invertase Pin-like site-specific DNA recombinase
MRPPRPKHRQRGADSGRAESGHSNGSNLHGVIRKLRCAVYTRKSSEEGLEMEFNSLDAQREACQSYIASQRGEGWVLVADRYDDGGVSGGTLDRPALKRLLADVEAGRIDIVVVRVWLRLRNQRAMAASGIKLAAIAEGLKRTEAAIRYKAYRLNIMLPHAWRGPKAKGK